MTSRNGLTLAESFFTFTLNPHLFTRIDAMPDLDSQQKIALINENLQEVLRPDIIENVIVTEGRPLAIYWGNVLRHCFS